VGSAYNIYPLPAEVLVLGERADVVRARQTLEEAVAGGAGAGRESKRHGV